MILCAFLGITADQIAAEPPYARVLGFSDAGKAILKSARASLLLPHIGDRMDDPYQLLERRCDDLYGLFAVNGPETAGTTEKRRVYIRKNAGC